MVKRGKVVFSDFSFSLVFFVEKVYCLLFSLEASKVIVTPTPPQGGGDCNFLIASVIAFFLVPYCVDRLGTVYYSLFGMVLPPKQLPSSLLNQFILLAIV